MRKRITSVAVALFLVVAGVATAEAQADSPTITATVNIPTVLFVDVSSTSVTFSGVDATDFENGVVPSDNSMTVDTKGNVVHDLTVQAQADNFTGGSGSKPATDLLWSTSGAISAPADGSSVPQASAGSAANVATGLSQGNPPAVSVDYGILLDYATDAPDTYSLDFVYTVVAN